MRTYIGLSLGGYQIVQQIGQGGMATVFKAYQPTMDRYVAVKVLPSHLCEDETFMARFSQEARTLARLEHPHILPVHDYGEQDGITYLVMRYVEAGTLRDLIARQGPLPLKEVARIIDQVGRALEYAHSQGVLHRDVKPGNVLVNQRGDTFLTDFGIAKLMAETAKFTASGAIIGTPAYMAPEQGLGEPVDHRCDIYALGVMLYELVTGQVPYEAETPLAVVLKHIHDPLPMPRVIRPDLPEAVERVLLKAMAKSPADRFQTALELVEALSQAVAGLPVEAPASTPPAEGLAVPLLKEDVAPVLASAPQAVAKAEAAPGPAAVPQPAEAPSRSGPEAPAVAPPQEALSAPRRRRVRWLPLVAGAGGLVVLAVVAAVLLSGRAGRSGQASPTPPVAARAGEAQPTSEPQPLASQPTGTARAVPTSQGAPATPTTAPALPALVAGWTSFTNANLGLSVARQDDLLWLGSEAGLVRCDLATGEYLKLGVLDGLAAGRIHDLLVDPAGSLWAATSAGISRLQDGTWTTFDVADGLDSNWVTALLLDEEGALWAGTVYGDRGLNYYDGSRWGPPPVQPLPGGSTLISALARDASRLFVGLEDAGLASLDGQTWTVLGSKDGLPADKVRALMSVPGTLWAGFDDGLVRFDLSTGEWEQLLDTTIYAIGAAPDGAVWLGGWESALRLDPGTGDWQSFEPPDGPFGQTVTDIAAGEDGVWLATYGDGAVRYDGRAWTGCRTADGIGGNMIVDARLGKDGSVWVTHPGNGLSRYDPVRDAWQAFREKEGALDWPSAPGVDSQGKVWIADEASMAWYDGRGWQTLTVPELQEVGVRAMAIGPDDTQWLATDAGVMRHDPATEAWTTFSSSDHPALVDVGTLLIASDGGVWAGGDVGIARYDGHAWSTPPAAGSELVNVGDAAEAPDGSIWLAADGSLYNLVGSNRYVYRWPTEGWLESVAIAPDGSVWAGYEGVGHLDPITNKWQIYGTGDGLVDMRVNDIAVTEDGVVWLGTDGGVSRFVPPRP